jgi:hypothetical protein
MVTYERPRGLTETSVIMANTNAMGWGIIDWSRADARLTFRIFTSFILVGYVVLWFFGDGQNWARILVLLTSILCRTIFHPCVSSPANAAAASAQRTRVSHHLAVIANSFIRDGLFGLQNPNCRLLTSLRPLLYHLASRNPHHAIPGESQCQRVRKVVKTPLACGAAYVVTERSFLIYQEKPANTASNAART